MNFISCAQNCEDVMLWRALKHVEQGFYIDVGANDPVQDSVTKAFYDRGWKGINIEPVIGWYKKLSLERQRDINLQVAAGDHNGELRFYEIVGTGLSTTREEYATRHAKDQGFEMRELVVPVQTLTTIFHEHTISEIHFLKIDVEGSEKSVLEGLDLSVIRPWIILVEATQPQTEILDYQRWESVIVEKDYQFVYFDGLNRFYVANERADLAIAFTVPPNPWDRYERLCEYEAKNQVEVLSGELNAKSDELNAKSDELNAKSDELREQEAVIQSLEVSLNKLLNSRSMRITAPLRKLTYLKEELKQLLKQLSRKAIFTIVSQPRLRRIAKPIADKNPALQYRLSRFLHGDSKSSLTTLDPLNDTDLSSRSARILEDLRRVSE